MNTRYDGVHQPDARRRRGNWDLVLFLALALLFIYLVALWPAHLHRAVQTSYAWSLLCFAVVGAGTVVVLAITRGDLLDPMILFSLIYLAIFGLQPAVDIQNEDSLFFGVDLTFYAPEALGIATIGYVFAWLGWAAGFYWRRTNRVVRTSLSTRSALMEERIAGTRVRALRVWAIAFSASILTTMLGGKGLLYILTLGASGSADTARLDTPLGFLGFLGLAMIPSATLYAHARPSLAANLVLQFCTFSALSISGFRYHIFIFAIAHVTVYYLTRRRTPRVFEVVGGCVLLALFNGFMGFYRSAMRKGADAEWSTFEADAIAEALWGNFQIYKTFFAGVASVPEVVPFGLGRQMIWRTVTLVIPRAVWPDKPLPVVNEPFSPVSSYAAIAGAAYPNVGEFYFEFGIIGVCGLMMAFGYLMARSRVAWRHSENLFDMVLYGCFLGAILQLTIRGYTPTNFYMMLMLLGPTVVMRGLARPGRGSPRPSEGSAFRESDQRGHPDAGDPSGTRDRAPSRHGL